MTTKVKTSNLGSDLNLPGVPTAPTPSIGDNSTTLSTTAFVKAALQILYPVGVIYTSTNDINPSSIFGFGTWSTFGAGRVTIGAGGSYPSGSTGGSADAIVVSHTHPFSATTGGQSATHTHNSQYDGRTPGSIDYTGAGSEIGGMGAGYTYPTTANSNDHTHNLSGTTSATGSSATGANLPPYIVVYMWLRTA